VGGESYSVGRVLSIHRRLDRGSSNRERGGARPARGCRGAFRDATGPVAAAVVLAALTALAAMTAGAAGCRRAPPNLDSPGTAIVCLGDSITAGAGATDGHGYPEVLAARLGVEVGQPFGRGLEVQRRFSPGPRPKGCRG
jgi:hypothetical protein